LSGNATGDEHLAKVASMRKLAKKTVAEIMSTGALCLNEDMSVGSAVAVLGYTDVAEAPVVDDAGACVGVFGLAEVARRYLWILAELDGRIPGALEHVTVGDWMSTDVISVAPDTSVLRAARIMIEDGTHPLVVRDGTAIVGIVSAVDFVRFFAGSDGLAKRAGVSFDRARDEGAPRRRSKTAGAIESKNGPRRRNETAAPRRGP
jgi:CBS domain-containing protein